MSGLLPNHSPILVVDDEQGARVITLPQVGSPYVVCTANSRYLACRQNRPS